MQLSLKTTLEYILSQPTAPFRETWVADAVKKWCQINHIALCEDSFKNLWVNCKNLNETKHAHLALVAHMDHPGFVINKITTEGKKILAHAKWLGGGPQSVVGFPVLFFSKSEHRLIFKGKVMHQTSNLRGPDTAVLEIFAGDHELNPKNFKTSAPWGACLSYKNEGFKKSGALHGRAADDLVGVAAMLVALGSLKAAERKGSVLLVTRAEESGFHGALHVLEKKMLNPKKTLMLSIETSMQMPGARLGLGPVIRLGDRSSVFHGGFVRWIEKQAGLVKSRNKKFIFQKKLMDGGSCEATAFNCYGFTVAGVSTPLENYHNQKNGGMKPHPEIVQYKDVENLTRLIAEIIANSGAGMMAEIKSRSFEDLKKTLVNHYRKEVKLYARLKLKTR